MSAVFTKTLLSIITLVILIKASAWSLKTEYQLNVSLSKYSRLQNNIESTLFRRRERLNNQCVLDPKFWQTATFAAKNIIYNKEYNFSWCPVYKGGSTQWMWNLAHLSKHYDRNVWDLLKTKMHISKYVKYLYKNYDISDHSSEILTKLQDIQNSKKIIIVRHPFERLLSAYRDKLEKPMRKFFYKAYGNHIASGYEKSYGEISTSNRPTFTQFLKFIVNEQNFNEHWRPYYIECDPCNINYDFILKLETIGKEQEYVFNRLNVTIPNFIKRGSKDNLQNENPDGHTNKSIAQRYFSQVSQKLLLSVYKIFEPDFLLFGYVPDWYYNISNNVS